MKRFAIGAIGELLWDVLPTAEVLGGAPMNFAYQVTALGARGYPISAVGDDLRGARALAELRRRGVETAGISVVAGQATGHVDAVLDPDGVATYRFPAEVAWDHLRINDFARDLQSRLDAICFGSLAQRSAESRRVIGDYLQGLRPETVRICDINLRQELYSRQIVEASLGFADILKLNEEELPVLARLLGLGGGSTDQWLRLLLQRYGLRLAILTRGRRGSLLLTPAGRSDHPGIAADPAAGADTIGAGDAFTAAVTVGYLAGMTLDRINDLANRLAAYVCSRQGAMPDLPDSLKMSGNDLPT